MVEGTEQCKAGERGGGEEKHPEQAGRHGWQVAGRQAPMQQRGSSS